MRPSFLPRLVNEPLGDPGLFIPFLHQKRAIIFDLGDIHSLSARDILKISHVFVTHTHMDHFIGFDRLLRLFLGRDQDLYLYGPEGYMKNIEGKLSGYSWNLVQNYSNYLALHVFEVHADHLTTRDYICQKGFVPEDKATEHAFDGSLHEEPTFSVSARVLDHGLSCLGLSVMERFHVNIKTAEVARLGLEIGPWIREFKQALFDHQDPGSTFKIPSNEKQRQTTFTLKDLAEKIAIITPGQKVSYITDVAYSESNVAKILELVKDSDQLFIEASFLDQDKEMAEKKGHLTARQAGLIAGKAKVQRVTPFHFSPRYQGQEPMLEKEVMEAYENALNP